MSRIPPLIALRAFDALGRTGSVRAAGEELGVSHTVVSRHIRNLEERLQVRLIAPLGRGVALTPEGARFHAEIAKAFEAIAQATIDLDQGKRKSLEIWCVPGLANRRLLPQMASLGRQLPDFEIVLRPTLSRPNLERGEADAEIIYLTEPESRPGRRAHLLAHPKVFPVASPAFCARYGPVRGVEDLVRLPLLHEQSTEQWREWLTAAGHAPAGGLNGTRLWHAHLAIEAARLGQGVALTNEILAGDELRSAELLEVTQNKVALGSYYLVSLAAREKERALRALTRWLAEIFGAAGVTGAGNAPIAAN